MVKYMPTVAFPSVTVMMGYRNMYRWFSLIVFNLKRNMMRGTAVLNRRALSSSEFFTRISGKWMDSMEFVEATAHPAPVMHRHAQGVGTSS